MTLYDDIPSAAGRDFIFGGEPRRVHASLRLFHEDLDPEELTTCLGVKPTRMHRRGDQRRGKDGRLYAPFRKGAWILDSEKHVKDKDINPHINWLLDQVAHCSGAIRRLQQAGYATDVMCGWFANSDNTCPSLDAETMRRLGVLRLGCWFDVYLIDPEDS